MKCRVKRCKSSTPSVAYRSHARLLRLVVGARVCRLGRCPSIGAGEVFRLSLQDVSVDGGLSTEYAQESVGNCPIMGTLAPPLLMQAFAPFDPIQKYGIDVPLTRA